MSNAAARSLLQHGVLRPRIGRINYDIARATTPTPYRSICQRCEQRPLSASSSLRPSSMPLSGLRSLHTSSALSKKKKEEAQNRSTNGRGKSADKSSEKATDSAADDGPKHPQPSPDEPLNFADVESRLGKNAEHYKAVLKQQSGAKFDADVIGALRVTTDKKTGETYPLRELAQVVPRGGRAVSLLVHEANYVKPIMSAVQASPQFNQQPQRDADNELELILKIEPEKREDVVKRVKGAAHDWRERVRAVRQKRDKLHVTWRKDGAVGPDLKRTVDKELEKIIKSAIAEVDEAEKSALKAFQ